MESWVGSKYVAFRRGYLAPTIVLNIQVVYSQAFTVMTCQLSIEKAFLIRHLGAYLAALLIAP